MNISSIVSPVGNLVRDVVNSRNFVNIRAANIFTVEALIYVIPPGSVAVYAYSTIGAMQKTMFDSPLNTAIAGIWAAFGLVAFGTALVSANYVLQRSDARADRMIAEWKVWRAEQDAIEKKQVEQNALKMLQVHQDALAKQQATT